MRRKDLRSCLIPTTLILLIALTADSPVSAGSSAILVYKHGFAKEAKFLPNGNLLITNETSTFTQDDTTIYAYALAAFYGANLTWQWYDPSGQLYQNSTSQWQCTSSPCYVDAWMSIRSWPAATRFGAWTLVVLDDGNRVYSDVFYINSILVEDNYWNFTIEQSPTSQVRGSLMVTIHPSNGTWNSYMIYLPYAVNVTASELDSNRPLEVTTSPYYYFSRIVVDFPGPRSAGYSFVIGFELGHGFKLVNLNAFNGGAFAFSWLDRPWLRGYYVYTHPVYETFTITLPKQAEPVDVIGQNALDLNYSLTNGERPSIDIATTVLTQVFGWTIIYKDLGSADLLHTAHPVQAQNEPTGSNFFTESISVLPLTPSRLNVWAAVMSIFLLTASELASPLYGRAGFRLLINRKRLRIAALMLAILFIALTTSQVFYSQYISVPH